MATQTAAAFRRAIRSVVPVDEADVADRDLLLRFVETNDQEAFATLVGRHSGMVLGVCRRSLPTAQDAEDAAQATFLVLVREAKRVRWRPSLAGYLYATARKVAHNARVAAQRRARREARAAVPEAVAPVDRMTVGELLAILDRELDSLSATYREPLVLCYLQGLTRDQAAARLSIPVPTLNTRIDRARKKLHDVLTKGGCALGAGLLALAVTSPARASSPQLVQAILATASGTVPDAVTALAKGVAVNGIAKRVGMVLVAALGVAVLGLGLESRTSPVVGQPPRKLTANGPQGRDVKPPADKPKPFPVAGQVIDPDGKPVAGAEVACGPATTTTEADGRFRLNVTPADPRDAVTVTATAKGLGPDWAVLGDSRPASEVTLTLTTDDVPFTGRVANLENQPLKGVTVEVLRVGKEGRPAADAAKALTLLAKEAMRRREIALLLDRDCFNDSNVTTVASDLVVARPKTTTDAEGKFKLTGFGRERLIEVRMHGPGVETRRFWVITRPGGPKDGFDTTHLYPPDGMILLAPSRPLVGTVRDAKTGKPVAGVTVSEVRSPATASVTDENGRYQIEGAKKKKSYFIGVVGGRQVPLFQTPAQEVADTGGLGDLETNLTVELGLGLSGRVVAKSTGEPIAADVYYLPADDNPGVKDLPADRPRFASGQTDRDGRFFLPAWPGKGAIVIQIREDGPFPPVDAERLLTDLNVSGPTIAPSQAVVPVNIDAPKPESLDVTIPLESGLVRKGTVLGPDDKPLAGAQGAGVIAGQFTGVLATPDFIVTPMRPGVKRLMIFFHAEKKLGAIQAVEGTSADPFTVKLQPLGSVTGEVHKDDNLPWPGLTVTAVPVEDDAGYENLPRENVRFQGERGTRKVPWWDWTRRTATTDEKGDFRLDGLLPGRDYHLYVSDGDLGEKGTLVRQGKVSAPSGRVLDLGVLKKSPE